MAKTKVNTKDPRIDENTRKRVEEISIRDQLVKEQQDALTAKAPTKPNTVSTFQNQTGRDSGITLPDGRTFLGLGPDDVRAIKEGEDRKNLTATGGAGQASAVKTVAQQAQETATIKQLMGALGGIGQEVAPTVPQELAGTGPLAVAGGAAAFAGGALAGGTTGAAIGAIGGPAAPVTVPVVAALGALVGGLSALGAKITASRRQTTKNAYKVYTDSKARDKELLNIANSGTAPPAEVIEQYNRNLANLRVAEKELLKQTRSSVGRELSGAMDELISLQSYMDREPERRRQLTLALLNPNPSLIYGIDESNDNTAQNEG